MVSASIDTKRRPGYSSGMAKETKTKRYNMWMKPSVRQKLAECAQALRKSDADTIEEAILRLYKSRDVKEARGTYTATPPTPAPDAGGERERGE